MERLNTYATGFNCGYYLAKFEPEILTKVLVTLAPDNDFLAGIFSGMHEYEYEYTAAALLMLSAARTSSIDHNKDLEQEF